MLLLSEKTYMTSLSTKPSPVPSILGSGSRVNLGQKISKSVTTICLIILRKMGLMMEFLDFHLEGKIKI